MNDRHLTPAEVVERLIGPPIVVGEIVGRDRTAVIKWRRTRRWRSAGDLPGDEEKRALLTYARERGIPLTAEHLIWGASEAELDALSTAPRQEDAA